MHIDPGSGQVRLSELVGWTREAEPGADRLAELRQRVAAGAYDTPAVAERIARRLLERGDV